MIGDKRKEKEWYLKPEKAKEKLTKGEQAVNLCQDRNFLFLYYSDDRFSFNMYKVQCT